MADYGERCTKCGHLLTSHDAQTGCTERVPGTRERRPGACACGAPEALAEVILFRPRAERDADLEQEFPSETP